MSPGVGCQFPDFLLWFLWMTVSYSYCLSTAMPPIAISHRQLRTTGRCRQSVPGVWAGSAEGESYPCWWIARQSVSKGLHRLRAAPLPEGRHAPGNLLLCIWNRFPDGFLKMPQNRLHFFRLLPDIFANGLGRFSAVMALIEIAEVPSAFRASPHPITSKFSPSAFPWQARPPACPDTGSPASAGLGWPLPLRRRQSL